MFDDTLIRLADYSDNKIHENHKLKESDEHVYKVGKNYHPSRLFIGVFNFSFLICAWIHRVETVSHVKDGKVTHGTS